MILGLPVVRYSVVSPQVVSVFPVFAVAWEYFLQVVLSAVARDPLQAWVWVLVLVSVEQVAEVADEQVVEQDWVSFVQHWALD